MSILKPIPVPCCQGMLQYYKPHVFSWGVFSQCYKMNFKLIFDHLGFISDQLQPTSDSHPLSRVFSSLSHTYPFYSQWAKLALRVHHCRYATMKIAVGNLQNCRYLRWWPCVRVCIHTYVHSDTMHYIIVLWHHGHDATH